MVAHLAAAAVAAAAAAALSGCSVSAGSSPDEISAAELSETSTRALMDSNPDQGTLTVTCAEPVPFAVGSSQECDLDRDGDVYTAAVTVTSAEGNDFEVEVEAGGRTLPAAEVAQRISEELTELVGTAPEKVECPEDLPGTVSATMTCALTDGDVVLDVMVVVDEVDGDQVAFDIEVADEPRG